MNFTLIQNILILAQKSNLIIFDISQILNPSKLLALSTQDFSIFINIPKTRYITSIRFLLPFLEINI